MKSRIDTPGFDDRRFLLDVTLLRDGIRSFDDFPFCVPAVRHLETLDLDHDVTFFIGENGTGKSTLLEAIAVAWGMNPEGGGRNFNFSTRAMHSPLDNHLRLTRSHKMASDCFFLRAESFYNVATEVDELNRVRGGMLSW